MNETTDQNHLEEFIAGAAKQIIDLSHGLDELTKAPSDSQILQSLAEASESLRQQAEAVKVKKIVDITASMREVFHLAREGHALDSEDIEDMQSNLERISSLLEEVNPTEEQDLDENSQDTDVFGQLFVEEATQQVATMGVLVSKFCANPDEHEALKSIREIVDSLQSKVEISQLRSILAPIYSLHSVLDRLQQGRTEEDLLARLREHWYRLMMLLREIGNPSTETSEESKESHNPFAKYFLQLQEQNTALVQMAQSLHQWVDQFEQIALQQQQTLQQLQNLVKDNTPQKE